MRTLWSMLLVIGAFAAVGCSAQNRAPVRAQNRSAVIAASTAVRDAILTADVGALSTYVAEGGILCGDDVIERGEVLQDLRDPASDLSRRLFADTHSLRSWFTQHPAAASRVDFMEEDRDDWACVRYVGEENEEWPELCFARTKRHWYLTNSLYRCE